MDHAAIVLETCFVRLVEELLDKPDVVPPL